MRATAIALGFLYSWSSRFSVVTDGISYTEIARNYAAGNWPLAVNTYWSPLYSWLLALAFVATGADRKHEAVILHALNFLTYAVALVLFDRLANLLVQSVEWKSTTARTVYLTCAYSAFLWAALAVLPRSTPDMLVLALVLLLSLLILDVRTKPISYFTLAAYGSLVSIAYLAKTALLGLAPFYFAVALWPFRPMSQGAKKAAAVCLPFLVICVGWMAMIRAAKGYWTPGESGKLNYAWEICGAPRWIHWHGEPFDIGVPLHPTRKLLAAPALYEFSAPISATYPPWYDPAYWYAGVRPKLKFVSQAKVLLLSFRYLVYLFLIAPGIPILAVLIISSRRLRQHTWQFRVAPFLLVAPVAMLLMYSAVFLDLRYVAGALLVIAVVGFAAVIPNLDSVKVQGIFYFTTVLACGCSIFLSAMGSALAFGHDLIKKPAVVVSSDEMVAEDALTVGLRPGDAIGYIGQGSRAYWPALAQVRIVAEVPVIYPRGTGIDNHELDDTSEIEQFWRCPAERRAEVLALMKKSGARAVVADLVPAWADTRGWIKLKDQLIARCCGYKLSNGVYRDELYIRFLD